MLKEAIIEEQINPKVERLEKATVFFLILMVLFSPHSIAASQTAWITGSFLLLIRFFFKPKLNLQRTPLDAALWAFFLWSFISCILSYTPLISLDRLRSVAIFLVLYFVINCIKTREMAIKLCFLLIGSCMINVIYVPIERILGRGVEIHGLSANGPLTKALLMDGDTLLKVNGKKITSADELLSELEKNEESDVFFYRPDFYYTVKVKRNYLLPGDTSLEKLGIQSWKKSHNWRSTGFFGHWTTYADVLQLIASLTFGILIALASQLAYFSDSKSRISRRNPLSICLLFFSFAMMILALVFSGTRAPLIALLISATCILFLNKNKKMLVAFTAISGPILLIGSMYLHQSRGVGFIDERDESTRYRQVVYREALQLWSESFRHVMFGIGMDSVKVYAEKWGLFDNGKLPMGHFHSTPIQILVERGLPALLIWIWIILTYSKILLSALKKSSGIEKGVLLGIFGGFIGFLISGLVHYNLGDQEVAMIFFLLMGIAFTLYNSQKLERLSASNTSTRASGKNAFIRNLILLSSNFSTAR